MKISFILKAKNLGELNEDIKNGIEGVISIELYIGEGGKSKKNEHDGTMGHRVIQHLYKKEWRTDAINVCMLPIFPREFSKLAE